MDTKEGAPLSVFHSCVQVASDQRVNLFYEMKGKGTPKDRRIPFLRFVEMSGRTILNTEPSELNTLIQYAHDVYLQDGRHKRMPNGLRGQMYKINARSKKDWVCFFEKTGKNHI